MPEAQAMSRIFGTFFILIAAEIFEISNKMTK